MLQASWVEVISYSTVFRNSIERWADGLKTLEMVQGGNFGNEQGTWEAPRWIRGDLGQIRVIYKAKIYSSFSCYYCFNPENPQKLPANKTPSIAPPANIIQRWFDASRIMTQRFGVGRFGPITLQGEAVGQFSGFISVFLYFFISKPEVPNFDALACKLGEPHIQNSHPMFTYNIPGISSSIFIGFCGIEFWTNMRSPPISETLCGVNMISQLGSVGSRFNDLVSDCQCV